MHTNNPASTSSRHHAETRHPGTADAVHRHARAGLRERNGLKFTLLDDHLVRLQCCLSSSRWRPANGL